MRAPSPTIVALATDSAKLLAFLQQRAQGRPWELSRTFFPLNINLHPSSQMDVSWAPIKEAATAAASSGANLQDDEEMEVATTAEPQMEVYDTLTEAEPDAEDQQDLDEHEDQDEVAERPPLLPEDRTILTDPNLTQARVCIQVPYYPRADQRDALIPGQIRSRT